MLATQPTPAIQRMVACPATGAQRPASDCGKFNGEPPTHNPMAMQQWRACQDCQNRTDADGIPARLALVKPWPEDAAVTRERWDNLTNRLILALGNGLTIERIVKESALDARWLELFAGNPDLVRGNAPRAYPDEPTHFETKVDTLESYLAKYETERLARSPGRVLTTVTKAVIRGIADARALGMIVLVDAVPGLGKTEGAREFIAKARAAEGFRCNVWMIRLEESGVSPLNVLCQIADEIVGYGKFDRRNLPAVSRAIRQATEGIGGVLIVDEAQHLAQEGIQGPKVLNSLRQFCATDWNCFGIALLANGEVYQRYGVNDKFAQLYSRVAKRIEIFGLKDAKEAARRQPPVPALQITDVRAIAAAWGIVDPEIVAWCVRIAEQPGTLRKLSVLLMRAIHEYGIINRAALIDMGVWE